MRCGVAVSYVVKLPNARAQSRGRHVQNLRITHGITHTHTPNTFKMRGIRKCCYHLRSASTLCHFSGVLSKHVYTSQRPPIPPISYPFPPATYISHYGRHSGNFRVTSALRSLTVRLLLRPPMCRAIPIACRHTAIRHGEQHLHLFAGRFNHERSHPHRPGAAACEARRPTDRRTGTGAQICA